MPKCSEENKRAIPIIEQANGVLTEASVNALCALLTAKDGYGKDISKDSLLATFGIVGCFELLSILIRTINYYANKGDTASMLSGNLASLLALAGVIAAITGTAVVSAPTLFALAGTTLAVNGMFALGKSAGAAINKLMFGLGVLSTAVGLGAVLKYEKVDDTSSTGAPGIPTDVQKTNLVVGTVLTGVATLQASGMLARGFFNSKTPKDFETTRLAPVNAETSLGSSSESSSLLT